jgi:ribosomal protein RSM22 (predicted rRNA methylase)
MLSSVYRRSSHVLLREQSKPLSLFHQRRRFSASLVYPRVAEASSDHRADEEGGDGGNTSGGDDDDDDSDDDGQHEPWKALLTTSGRCAWRVSQLPDPLNDIVDNIVKESHRTRKVLRRVHETVMEQHKVLAIAREKERQRLKSGGTSSRSEKDNNNKPQHGDNNSGTTSTNNNNKTVNNLIVPYGANEALADIYFRFVPHYLIVRRILEEAVSLIGAGRNNNHNNNIEPPPRLQVQRIIDLGIGCGGASVAALDVFGTSIEWIHGIDPSNAMKQAAERVLSDHPSCKPRVTVSSHLSITADTSHFDLALFCYTASEFPHNAATIAAAAALWEKLSVGGIFVMVEPGTPDGFRSIRTVRSMLLDCANDDETVFDIIAPCTHNGRCPMENFQLNNRVFRKVKAAKPTEQQQRSATKKKKQQNSSETAAEDEETANGGDMAGRSGFCSFVQTMPHGDKKEKFSYLVARKKPRGEVDDQQHNNNEFHGDRLAELLQRSLTLAKSEDTTEESAAAMAAQVLDLRERYLNSTADEEIGLELVRTDRSGFGRIVHAPAKKKGHVLIDACVAPGEMVRFKVRKSHDNQHNVPGVYGAAKKSRWGGFWPHVPHLVE